MQREVGAPFGSLRSLIGFRPSTESSGGDNEDRRKSMAPPDVVAEAELVATLEPGVQAVQLSPYRASLAAPDLTRLQGVAAFPAGCGSLRLSPTSKLDGPGATLSCPSHLQ
jgi:hypothetical protein